MIEIYTGKGQAGYFCDHDPTPALKIGNVLYYGATGKSRARIPKPKDGGLVEFISFVDTHYLNAAVSALQVNNKRFESLVKHSATIKAPAIVVDWPDFGNPPVAPDFWASLHETLSGLHKSVHAVFYCQGGHGRTGTALAAMDITVNGSEAQSAVYRLRDAYCKGAVETTGQEDYLLALDLTLNGREIPSNPFVVRSEVRTDKGDFRGRRGKRRNRRERW